MHSCEENSDLPDNHAESGSVIPKPNLDFEDGTHSIFMIIQRFPFPVVVLCDTTRCPIPVDRSKFNFDLSQPLLFYRKRSIQKIPARSLFVDEKDQYQEAGDPLLIPEDYKGYFAILKRRNLPGPPENHAPHFTKIEDIALSDTEKFLIGGQNRVKAFQVTNHKDNDQSHHEQQRMLFPGDVLRKIRMFTSETKKKTKYLRRSSLVTERFLLCMDEADREVVIPFTQAGLFYALTTTSGKGTCPVMQMSEIVASKYLPCVVKLVYGRVPTTPCFFSGLLQLDHGYLEQSIVAATIMNKKNILVEIPSSCKMEFRVAHTNDELISNQGYQNAVQVCREKIHSYMRNIKVCLSWKSDDALHGSITVGERISRVSIDSEISEPPKPCSKDVNRDSGYMKMTPSTDDLSTQSDGNLESGQDQYVKMVSPTSPTPDYVLKLFLENKLLEVPVYSHDANQIDDVDDSTNMYTLKASDNRGQHITTPPDLPPPPVPCPGTPPPLCGGSPSQDSGISDIGHTDIRRPSTFIFAENEQNPDDDITYDIPQIPTRRVSAPPNFDTIPVIPDSKRGAISKSSPFNKRKSKSIKNRVSSAPPEMLNKDGRLISPTETIHELDFVTEKPRYENIDSMKETQEKLIQHKNFEESINMADDSTGPHSSWYLGPLDSSDQHQASPSASSCQRNCNCPPYVSSNCLDDNALRSMSNESPRLSCGSVTSSDPSDSVFEMSPSDPTPHDYQQLKDAKVKCAVEEDHEDVYDVIPEIPGSNPLEMMHMSDKEYIDHINSDLVEHEQPPNPHHMQHATHTYVNYCGEESKECEDIGEHVDVSLGKTECNQQVDTGSNSTMISEPHHAPFSDTGFGQHNESVTGRVVKENKELLSKQSDSDNDQTDVDQSKYLSNFEGLNPIIVESDNIEPAIGQENPLEKDNVYPVTTGETGSENKCGENEAKPQEEEGYVNDDNCDNEGQHNVQDHSGVSGRCGATERQQNDSDQRRRGPISDTLVPPNEAHDISLQVKPDPPPVSPKPSRTHMEKRETVSEEISETVVSNSNESSQFDYIDDQPVHHQLKHRERTESNSICMSPEHLEKELKDVGVTRKARENIKDRHLGIEELLNMDVDNLQKDLPDVSFLDLKRIAMFIRNMLARPTGY